MRIICQVSSLTLFSWSAVYLSEGYLRVWSLILTIPCSNVFWTFYRYRLYCWEEHPGKLWRSPWGSLLWPQHRCGSSLCFSKFQCCFTRRMIRLSIRCQCCYWRRDINRSRVCWARSHPESRYSGTLLC